MRRRPSVTSLRHGVAPSGYSAGFRRRRRGSPEARGSWLVFAAYLFYVGLFSLAPYDFEWQGVASALEQLRRRFEWWSGASGVAAWDVWTNILLYVPYGILFVARPAPDARVSRSSRLWSAGLTSCFVSLSFEAAQVFLPRQPSIQDVVWNVAGAVIGGLIGSRRRHGGPVRTPGTLRSRTSCKAATIGMAALLLLAAVFVAVPLPLAADLESWGTELEVRLGLADGLRAPWRGIIYRVAVYRRALRHEEVLKSFLAGPNPAPDGLPIREGLVLAHQFSSTGQALVPEPVGVSVSIGDPARARWLTPSGLRLDGTSLTFWCAPPLRPTGWRFYPHQEFTVEVWMATADPAQVESVRIVSYSRAPPGEKLTLSQYRREFELRLNPLGDRPPWWSSGRFRGPEREAIRQVLITHRDGVGTRYVNAVQSEHERVRVNQAFIDVLLEAVGEHFRWPVWSLLIFGLAVQTYLWQFCRARSAPPTWRFLPVLAIFLSVLILFRLIVLHAIEPVALLVGSATILVALLVAPQVAQYCENR